MLFFFIIFILNSCSSKIKEGAELTIYNETKPDIYIIDKFTFMNQPSGNALLLIDVYDNSELTGKSKKYHLKDEYITMYTDKTLFFPLQKYKDNKSFGSLTFYFIKKENLDQSKNEILRNKLYDSCTIDLKKFHQMGSDNHLYYKNKGIRFISY